MQNQQDTKIKALAKTIQTIWDNQVKLEKRVNFVEEQFCVLGRLLIPKTNELIALQSAPELSVLRPTSELTEEAINAVFYEWREFRKRPDFRAHFVPWFMGEPLSELPEIPEELKKEESLPDTAAQGNDAEEFGGDYGEGKENVVGNERDPEGQQASGQSNAEDAVPQVQDPDATASGEGRGVITEVPQVS